MKIAFFTSLIEETLSKKFSDAILPYLKTNFEIDIFCDEFKTYQDFNTQHYLQAINKKIMIYLYIS